MSKKIYKLGFTLFEVITVMIIIAIVVGVSLRIAKNKISNIKAYTYYAAYQTLSEATSKMLSEFSTSDETFVGEINHECPDGQVYYSEADTCEATSITIPRLGSNFCNLFVSYVNIVPQLRNGEEVYCEGDTVPDANISETGIIENIESFADMTPDFILKNGIRVYNMSHENEYNLDYIYHLPDDIPHTLGNPDFPAYRFNLNGQNRIVFTNGSGYIVFVDIDGSNGNSSLWQDVFPFYITMSGKVIPAFGRSRNNRDVGGNSREYLTVSSFNNVLLEGGRRINWLTRSVSFRQAACTSGYIPARAFYCSMPEPSIGLSPQCAEADSDCRIKVIPPTKWFN